MSEQEAKVAGRGKAEKEPEKSKEERLAEALRANLRKRKAASRKTAEKEN